jgi:DeoR family glycerol-3-phosphate regulon repressor
LPGGEVRLPDRDILGNDVLNFFGRFRAEFAVFGVAGIADDGGMLEFHTTEVSVRQKIRSFAKKSLLVVDWSKFGRQAPAVGDNIADIDTVIIDRRPGDEFAPLLSKIKDRLIVAEGEVT